MRQILLFLSSFAMAQSLGILSSPTIIRKDKLLSLVFYCAALIILPWAQMF
jgi:hypothetical protein